MKNIFVLLILFSNQLYAYDTQKYNTHTQKMETVQNQNWKEQYSPHQGRYVLAPERSEDRYNPYTSRFEMTTKDSTLKFNSQTKQYRFE